MINYVVLFMSAYMKDSENILEGDTVSLLPFSSSGTIKWFYIGYIERIFQKTITSLQNYGKWSNLLHVSNL